MPDPEQTDDAVRRLLADARHDEPLPPEVAERLDVLLGRLVEQRAAQAPVDELAVRRDRRRRLLLVAAAVAVVVVGTGGVISRLDPRSGSDQASDSAAESSDAGSSTLRAPADAPAEAPSSASSAPGAEQGTDGTERDQPEAAAPEQARRSLPLTDAGFEAEVRDALATPTTTEAYGSSLTLLLDSCVLPADAPTGPETTSLPATYGGRDAVLVAAAPVAGRRQVGLYLCGEPTPERTTEVDASR